MAGTLYIVATPIGNLGDVTFRALETLKSVDFIFCEDTRVTQKLLSHYGIKKPYVRYNEHTGGELNNIYNLLIQSKNVALVSDAGTPGISDPGGKLVEYIAGEAPDIKIAPIPGSCALICAASISGFGMDKFLYLGFPPVKKRRKKFFEEIANTKYPVIFYESPHRILKSLAEVASAIGAERHIIVCREMTKKFETIYRGTVAKVLHTLKNEKIRGEFVIIVK